MNPLEEHDIFNVNPPDEKIEPMKSKSSWDLNLVLLAEATRGNETEAPTDNNKMETLAKEWRETSGKIEILETNKETISENQKNTPDD